MFGGCEINNYYNYYRPICETGSGIIIAADSMLCRNTAAHLLYTTASNGTPAYMIVIVIVIVHASSCLYTLYSIEGERSHAKAIQLSWFLNHCLQICKLYGLHCSDRPAT